jgi:putative sigma-54 modulation protein
MLDVTISGRHVDVTDAMRDHAREQVAKLERHSSHLMRATVTLAIEGERHLAEVIGVIRGKSDVVGKHESHDMYLSIDQAAAKVERQLQKLEAKYHDHRGRVPPRSATPLGTEEDEGEEAYEEA